MSLLHQDKRIAEDEWFSRILNRKTYRLAVPNGVDEGLRASLAEIKKEVRNSALFIYAKVDVRELQGIRFLEEEGFHLVDTNVVFEKPVSRGPFPEPPCIIRLATPADQNQTVDLARRSFHASRFHLDPQIGLEQANRLKAEWMQSFFLGKRGDQMVLAEELGKITGFLLMMKMPDGAVLIDLIAVDSASRQKGTASAMIAFAQKTNPTASSIRVGTQVANVASIRLYEKLGFRLTQSQYVFHYHRAAPQFS